MIGCAASGAGAAGTYTSEAGFLAYYEVGNQLYGIPSNVYYKNNYPLHLKKISDFLAACLINK